MGDSGYKNTLYSKMMDNLDIDGILKCTKNYRKSINVNNNRYSNKVYYRIKALIYYGRFDEAEQLCFEALNSNLLEEKTKYMINVCLSHIYFYRKEYIKCLYYVGKSRPTDSSIDRSMKSSIIYGLIKESNPDLYKMISCVPKLYIINHVQKKNDRHFNISISLLLDVIGNNFNKARTYYHNTMQIRIFRCFNVGIDEFKDKKETCDYIVCCSIDDDIFTTKTCYVISSPGSLEYYDITRELYQRADSTHKFINRDIKSNTDKFLARQRKKNTKIENK